jgi:diguanylate cyclase (GGDEF)-like protein/PAS domain S-box-containing protein
MTFTAFSRNSLKTRVTMFTLLIFLISIWSLSFYASRILHENMRQLLGEQQSSTLKLVADATNHELRDRLEALEKVAAGFNPALLGNPAALQNNLDQRPVFQELFNGGVFVTGVDGVALVTEPVSLQRRGISFLDRDYVADTLQNGKSTIGLPIMGKLLSVPVFGMAAPIRDARGKVIGVLAGVTNLAEPNFLGALVGNRYGTTGGYVLLAPQQRVIVVATDKSLVMQPLPAAGVSPLVDSHVRGETSPLIGRNAQGVEVLSSVAPIPVAGWGLVLSLPTDDAFAPIRAMQWRLLLATVLLTLLAGGLTWWMLKRQLAPLLAASDALATAADNRQEWQPLPIVRKDEIGNLIRGFNRLQTELGQREALLQKVLDTSSVAIFLIDPQGRITQANHRMAEMFGYSVQSLLELEYVALVDPAERAAVRQQKGELLRGAIPPLNLDRMYWRSDHSQFWGHLTATRFVDAQGQDCGILGVIVDITERKRTEEIVRQLAYYDPLTNLANRLLLRDRLTQAMLASKRTGRHCALMFLDLDNFKLLNDTHGHGAGDLLLIEVAARLKRCIREVDTVARFGGDEFVVLLMDLPHDKALAQEHAALLAEKIRSMLAAPYVLRLAADASRAAQTIEHRCTASIGVLLFLGLAFSEEEGIKRADIAMYQAKEAGRDSVRFYDDPQVEVSA